MAVGTEKDTIAIGTRPSPLALVQAEFVAESLRKRGFSVQIHPIRTTGDRSRNLPLPQLDGKGIFVKEIEDALLLRQVRLAVHSLKDLPTELPPGLCLASVPTRENPLDVLVLRPNLAAGELRPPVASRSPDSAPPRSGSGSRLLPKAGGRDQPSPPTPRQPPAPLDRLPLGAKVGTSSPRRAAQLLHLRPDLQIFPLRGNLDTRLRKLHSIPLDAIIAAAAGLLRLQGTSSLLLPSPLTPHPSPLISFPLSPEVCTPAPGQGALAIEARTDDDFALNAARTLEDPSARRCVEAERAFLTALGGGCRVPIGALAQEQEAFLTLIGVISSINGERLVRLNIVGDANTPQQLGLRLAQQLLQAGGAEIVREFQASP